MRATDGHGCFSERAGPFPKLENEGESKAPRKNPRQTIAPEKILIQGNTCFVAGFLVALTDSLRV